MDGETAPKVLYDFTKPHKIEKVEFQMESPDSLTMKLTLRDGGVVNDQLLLQSSGEVEHIWGRKIENLEK